MYGINQIFGFYRRKILPGFKVGKNALVVDFGSGDKPFWRADVFVDDLSIGNNQRATRGNIVNTMGSFVNANLLRLPFTNKAFDFSFASHVLEHVEDPNKAIREIVRVSKAGYLEFPNGFFETLSPAPSHLWCIFKENSELIFVRKSRDMQNVFFSNKMVNKNLASKMPQPFTSIYWRGKIIYRIIDVKNSQKFSAKNEKFTPLDHYTKSSLYLYIIRLVRFMFYKQKPNLVDTYMKSRRY